MIGIDNAIARLYEEKEPFDLADDDLRQKWMGRWGRDAKLKTKVSEAHRSYVAAILATPDDLDAARQKFEAAVIAHAESIAETNRMSPFNSDRELAPPYDKIIGDLRWLKNVLMEIEGDPLVFMASQPTQWDHTERPPSAENAEDYAAFHKAQVLRELKTRLEGFGYVFEDLIQ